MIAAVLGRVHSLTFIEHRGGEQNRTSGEGVMHACNLCVAVSIEAAGRLPHVQPASQPASKVEEDNPAGP